METYKLLNINLIKLLQIRNILLNKFLIKANTAGGGTTSNSNENLTKKWS